MNEKTNKPETKRKWANYLIYPRFQTSLIAFNLVILLGALGLVYYQVNKSFWVIENYAKTLNMEDKQNYFKLIDFHMELISDAILTALIICSLLLILYNLIFSHKSAGAVYRMKTYFQSIEREGHKRELTFRDGDMHADIPQVVNAAIERIKTDAKNE